MSKSSPSPRLVGLWFVSLVTFVSVAGIYALHASLPENPIHLPLQDPVAVAVVLPESWAFFTRNPREERVLPYVQGDDGRFRVALEKRRGPQRVLGISRALRAQAVEVGALASLLAADQWAPCEDSDQACLEDAPIAREIDNPTPDPTLCGTVGLTAREPVPWAWWRSPAGGDVRMPLRVAKMRVRC